MTFDVDHVSFRSKFSAVTFLQYNDHEFRRHIMRKISCSSNLTYYKHLVFDIKMCQQWSLTLRTKTLITDKNIWNDTYTYCCDLYLHKKRLIVQQVKNDSQSQNFYQNRI